MGSSIRRLSGVVIGVWIIAESTLPSLRACRELGTRDRYRHPPPLVTHASRPLHFATMLIDPDLGSRFSLRVESFSHADFSAELYLPLSSEELIDESDFEIDERLPYWAELW